MYLSSGEGRNRRGRPLGRWEDKVKEYVSDRGVRGNGLEWEEGSVWIGRGGDPSAVATPLGDASGGSEALELLIDIKTLTNFCKSLSFSAMSTVISK